MARTYIPMTSFMSRVNILTINPVSDGFDPTLTSLLMHLTLAVADIIRSFSPSQFLSLLPYFACQDVLYMSSESQ